MEFVNTSVLLFIILLPLLYFLKDYINWKKKAFVVDKIPGPKAYPIIGTTYNMVRKSREDLFDFMQNRINDYRKHGIFRTWLGIKPEIHLMTPEYVEIVLSSQTILDKGFMYDFLHPWLGKGLLTNTGSSWHSRRKLLTPAFHFSILENFIKIFVEKSEILVNDRLSKLANGKEFDVWPEIAKCALDIICKAAMGVDVNAMTNTENEYVKAINKISELTTKRIINIFLYPDTIYNNLACGKEYKKCVDILHQFSYKIIKERKEEYLNLRENSEHTTNEMLGKKKRMAFLDLILEASMNKNLSDTDIREEVDTFMFEGHDTTTASICFTLYMLGNNIEVQKKAYQEIEEIFGEDKRPITLQDLNEMKYLERVIKESLRLFPSVPFIMRKNRYPLNIKGYDIPVGCTLVVHIFNMHRNPEIFPDPLKFDPDRFLPDVVKHRHPYSYVPFSAGPRNCIGQKFALLEEKTILASIIRNFNIKSVQSSTDMRFYPELILRGQKGVKLNITSRK